MALIRLCLPLANYYTEVYIVKLFKIDGYHLEKCIDIKDDIWINSNDIIIELYWQKSVS